MANKQKVNAVKFYNFTDEDFTCKWDGVPYTIKAGETIMFEDWKAETFAKHLIDRELNKKDIRTNNQQRRDELYNKIFILEKPIEAEDNASLQTKILNENVSRETFDIKSSRFCEFCDSKGARHKKNCTKDRSQASEKKNDEFEGLEK